jgi:hypothetical protein
MRVALLALALLPTAAWAAPLDMLPVGAEWVSACKGTAASERRWTVVKNDGVSYRLESEDGSFMEGPSWARILGLTTNRQVGGKNMTAEIAKEGNLADVATLKPGVYKGKAIILNDIGTFENTYDATVKPAVTQDTIFGKIKVIEVETVWSNANYKATNVSFYAPAYKSIFRNLFTDSNGVNNDCGLVAPPKAPAK